MMKGNIAQLMQQAQKMQENMQRAQEEVAALEVVGNAGGGMVSVTLGGRMDCRKVRIDPSVLADPEMARDLTPFRVTGRVQQSVWESLGDFDLLAPGQLDSIGVPTLVVHGREDPIPLASSEAAAAAMNAELVVIDRAGHVPYVERPDALFPALDRFLHAPR